MFGINIKYRSFSPDSYRDGDREGDRGKET